MNTERFPFERVQAVDEIIDEETIVTSIEGTGYSTRDIKRLIAVSADYVVDLGNLGKDFEESISDNAILSEKNSALIAIMHNCARELASVGSQDHRTKNEKMLSVIAKLLSACSLYKRNPEVDEIPF